MRKRSRSQLALVSFALLVLTVSVGACTGDDAATEVGTADLAAFCGAAPDPSQLTERFPDDVNAASARVTASIDESCVE